MHGLAASTAWTIAAYVAIAGVSMAGLWCAVLAATIVGSMVRQSWLAVRASRRRGRVPLD